MRVSAALEEAIFTLPDDVLFTALTEDVIVDMEQGDFSLDTVQEAFVGIFATYGVTEQHEDLVFEEIDSLGQSMLLDEGFLSWLKNAAKKALRVAGQAALDAGKEDGREAVSTSAKELKKRIKAKEKKEPPEPPRSDDSKEDEEDEGEPEEKPKVKRKPKRKAKSKTVPKDRAKKSKKKRGRPRKDDPKDEPDPSDDDEGESEKPSRKRRARPTQRKPVSRQKDRDDDDDDDEDSDDIRQNLRNIATKAFDKIDRDPGRVGDVLKSGSKKAVRAIARHGVRKGMKMVFGKWIKTNKGKAKKESIDYWSEAIVGNPGSSSSFELKYPPGKFGVKLLRSKKNNLAVKVEVEGNYRGDVVRAWIGNTIFLGLNKITEGMVNRELSFARPTGNLRKPKEVPFSFRKKIEKAVFEKLKKAEAVAV